MSFRARMLSIRIWWRNPPYWFFLLLTLVWALGAVALMWCLVLFIAMMQHG